MIKRVLWLSRYSLLSAISLALGFGRELIVSAHFGLSKELDVYVAILGFYLFLGVQVANSLEMVFVSKSAIIKTPEEVTAQLIRALKILLLINLVALSILYNTSDLLITTIFPGFTSEQQRLGQDMMTYLLIAIVFSNSAGLIKASLNTLMVFAPGLISGSIISVSSIIAVHLYAETIGISALLFGFIVGNGLVLTTLSIIFIKKAGLTQKIKINENVSKVSGLWKAAAIVFCGEVFYQSYSMTERSFASQFQGGTISAFFYAWTLVTVPLSLVVMPMSTVVYPKLAKAFGMDRGRGFAILWKYGGILFIFGLGIVILISTMSEWFVRMIYMRGNFSEEDAKRTASILAILIFTLPFSSFGRLLRYALYSLSNYIGPTISQITSWATLAVLAPILIPRHGVLGLAYACTASMIVQVIAMFIILAFTPKKSQYEN